jgi:NADPH:quinone reductase
VGLLVAAWARRLGATVIGTTSSEDKARMAREQGCQHVIVTRNYRFADEVGRICGGADVIVDGLGDAAREQNLEALAPCGHWISLGQASGALQPLDPNQLVHKSATFSRPVLFAWLSSPTQMQARTQRLWAALADGSLGKPLIERHALDAAAQAHARLESRQSMGSLVLVA